MFTIIGGDGKEYGPVSADKIREWIAGGRADLQTRARRVEETEWKTLADYAEFSAPPLVTPAAPMLAAEIVPEAPALEPAERVTRLVSALIDMLFGTLCLLPGFFLLGMDVLLQIARGEENFDEANLARMGAGLSLVLLGFLAVVITQTWLLSTRGQSLGKVLMNIRIVRVHDESAPGFLHAVLLRWWLIAILGVVPIFGRFFSLIDVLFIFRADRRCVHDLIAGTKVVKK